MYIKLNLTDPDLIEAYKNSKLAEVFTNAISGLRATYKDKTATHLSNLQNSFIFSTVEDESEE